jgi:hypothetical protein
VVIPNNPARAPEGGTGEFLKPGEKGIDLGALHSSKANFCAALLSSNTLAIAEAIRQGKSLCRSAFPAMVGAHRVL